MPKKKPSQKWRVSSCRGSRITYVILKMWEIQLESIAFGN